MSRKELLSSFAGNTHFSSSGVDTGTYLGSVLRQRKKIEGRRNVRREELTLLGEAHNLIQAVLKWLLQS